MAVSKEEILNTIANMTVLEIVDLISAMEAKFGVSAAAAVAAAPAGGAAAAAPVVEEQTEFNVILTNVGANKINIIKLTRTILPTLGLAEAKGLVEKAPVAIKEAVSKEEAESIKKLLTEAGATVEIK